MKILAINSSHRGEKGFTKILIDKISQGVKDSGAECEQLYLAKLKIFPCTGCNTCQKANHLLKCIFDEKDDVKIIFNKMQNADIIIYATPVYIFTISGLLKIFLDRLNSIGKSFELKLSKNGLFFHHITKKTCSKPFVIVTSCTNMENATTKNVISFFKTFSKFMDAPIAGKLIRKSSNIIKNCKNDKTFTQIIDNIYQAYYRAGKELALSGKITNLTQRNANQNIIKIPLFNILMKFKIFKKIAIKKAQYINKGSK